MIAPMLSELSALVGHDVELLEPRAGCWILAPVDRARLRTPFWQAVRASPGAGVWGSPAAALVGFAAGVEGWSHPRRAGPPEGLYALLQGLLATGPTPCRRRFNFEPPCRSKFEPGLRAVGEAVGCG